MTFASRRVSHPGGARCPEKRKLPSDIMPATCHVSRVTQHPASHVWPAAPGAHLVLSFPRGTEFLLSLFRCHYPDKSRRCGGKAESLLCLEESRRCLCQRLKCWQRATLCSRFRRRERWDHVTVDTSVCGGVDLWPLAVVSKRWNLVRSHNPCSALS